MPKSVHTRLFWPSELMLLLAAFRPGAAGAAASRGESLEGSSAVAAILVDRESRCIVHGRFPVNSFVPENSAFDPGTGGEAE